MWINVEDGYPPHGMEVLGYWDEYGEDAYVLVKMREGENYFEGSDVTVSMREVTHWRPLPPPPKQ
jgi:hypothetical protein